MPSRRLILPRLPPPHLDRPAGPANPFEALLLIAAAVQGAAVVVGLARPVAFTILDVPIARQAIGLLLLVGGLASVVGLFWRWHPVDGVLIKRVGLIALAGGTLAYAVAALATGRAGTLAGVYNVAFALACLVRVRQITAALAVYRRVHPETAGGRLGRWWRDGARQ